MIVITNIETINVPDKEWHELIHYEKNPNEYIPINNYTDSVEASYIYERIHGRRFCRHSDGLDVVIGMSKQASDVIGIQLDAWKNQEELIQSLRDELHYTKLEIDRRKNMSFINKVKFLFGILK